MPCRSQKQQSWEGNADKAQGGLYISGTTIHWSSAYDSLKAVYTLVEQLYTGAQRTIATISPSNQAPSLLSNVLSQLSVLPARVEENKRSAARAGAIMALSRAKAWQSELDPAELATGCPSFKEDGFALVKNTLLCVKEMRPLAIVLVEETELTKY